MFYLGRYPPMGPPHGLPGQPHVSSSTHPQNMGESTQQAIKGHANHHAFISKDMNLRGLLNTHGQSGGHAMMGNQSMNPYGSCAVGPQGGPSHAMMQNMRPNLMNGPNAMQNMNQGQGPNNNMMINGPRFGPNFNRMIPPQMRNMMPNVSNS